MPLGAKVPPRPLGVAFTHALYRDGAVHVLLYTLERLIRQGCPITTIFSPLEGPMRADFEALGIEVHVLPFTEESSALILQFLLAGKVDFVLASTMFRCDCVCMAAEIGLPSLWVIHEKWTRERMEELEAQGQLDVSKVRRAFAVCDRVVFVSQGQSEFYQKLFNAHGARSQVIYNGIRPVDGYLQSTAARREERGRLGYGPEDYLVLHIGTLSVRKGQLATAKAMAKLASRPEGSKVKVLMVGDLALNDMERVTPSTCIAMIMAHLALHKVPFAFFGSGRTGEGAAAVTMMDVQAQEQVNRLYLACDCVALPSLNEVLPMVLCEAMAFSRPVITTRIDFIPEAVTHGDNGFLVLPGDEGIDDLAKYMDKLSRDPALSARMGAAGRARVLRQFSLGAMGRQYRQAVDDIVRARAAPPMVSQVDTSVSALATAGATSIGGA